MTEETLTDLTVLLVNYLTINQQFGHEATENHSDQRQVISENGQAF